MANMFLVSTIFRLRVTPKRLEQSYCYKSTKLLDYHFQGQTISNILFSFYQISQRFVCYLRPR